MEKYHLRLFILLFIDLIFVLLMAIFSSDLQASDQQEQIDSTFEIDIGTFPSSAFIGGSNFAPGDQIQSGIDVQNRGQYDFEYTMTVYREYGSERLYDILNVEIEHEGSIIFAGPLKDLDVGMGVLKSGDEDHLHVTVHLPLHAGNEYQGLEAVAAFDFVAQGAPGDDDEPLSPTEPPGIDPDPRGTWSSDDTSSATKESGMDTRSSIEKSWEDIQDTFQDAIQPLVTRTGMGESDSRSGGLLPETASHWLVLLILGLLVIIMGIYLLKRQKKNIKA
ncbi:LPXTG cell wall anchor domain-containing protein [Salicibibacter cibi]|uniref:LPXTG cell wall anchor domain-containing protein n=1 Tax=Salicibibacter cibi TaxID=2743001 RepID=A0A7T7CGZ7_9BACI|nr:LPXTG cell wall anchor domain-containing protein [Salicibibacter cibi]QQK81634.1 LPXTG cell wall anchor domain-containing protein [Salicibibacter cibi]